MLLTKPRNFSAGVVLARKPTAYRSYGQSESVMAWSLLMHNVEGQGRAGCASPAPSCAIRFESRVKLNNALRNTAIQRQAKKTSSGTPSWTSPRCSGPEAPVVLPDVPRGSIPGTKVLRRGSPYLYQRAAIPLRWHSGKTDTGPSPYQFRERRKSSRENAICPTMRPIHFHYKRDRERPWRHAVGDDELLLVIADCQSLERRDRDIGDGADIGARFIPDPVPCPSRI